MITTSDNGKPRIIFIVGGARSGKSSFALREAERFKGKKLYLATAEPLDDEMKRRIEQHKKVRGEDWDTAEEPLAVGDMLKKRGPLYGAILVDCLTLWLSNVMGRPEQSQDMEARIEKEIDALAADLEEVRGAAYAKGNPSCIFIVANEVGMGIVPDNRLARLFRDMAGRLNQKVAGVADEVYLVASGLPLRLKG